MEHGSNCHLSSCLSLTFLPISCPYCKQIYCESHFLPLQHSCSSPGSQNYNSVLSETELLKRVLKSNSTSTNGGDRLPCQKNGCRKFSLEVQQSDALGASKNFDVAVKNGDQVTTFKHKAPTCTNCHALFCVAHLDPRNHNCTAKPPLTEGQERMQAAQDRKTKARELLAKNFPNRKR
ncbi:unnamed protein product [Sympodiomycopsis kandeliae]